MGRMKRRRRQSVEAAHDGYARAAAGRAGAPLQAAMPLQGKVATDQVASLEDNLTILSTQLQIHENECACASERANGRVQAMKI